MDLNFGLIVDCIDFGSQLVIQSQMHQIPVHVLFEHFSIDEIFASQFVDFLFADELVLIVNYFLLLFFEFFSDIFDVRNPFGSGAKLRNEKASNFRILKSGQDHTTVFDNSTHVDTVLWLNACKEMTLTVCDLDLFLIAKNYIFFVVVQKMNGVDWLIVR